MTHQSKRCSAALGVAALVAVTLLSGCGSSSNDDNSGNAGSSDAAGVAEATTLLKANSSGLGGDVPTEGSTPAAAKDVWVISCGSALNPCRRAGEAIADAGKVLGWKVTVFDGKLNPQTWNEGIRQAVVAKADAIITAGIDCPAVSQALGAAKSAGVKAISMFSYDCDDAAYGNGGKALYDHLVQSGPSGSMGDTGELTGALEAAWVIKDSGGSAKILSFSEKDQTILAYIGKGFAKQIQTCTGCKVLKTVEFTLPDIGPNLVQKARTALLQNPEAQYLVAPNDTSAALLNQAVTQAGKAGKVKVIGTLGDEQNVDSIRNGGPQAMTVGFDTAWIGWAAMDDLVRMFAGEKPVYSGWTVGIVDKDTLPEGSAYKGPVDYEAEYAKLWGKG